MIERRKSPRQKSLLRGVVCFGDSNCTSDCTVRDMSQSGVRLKFNNPPSVVSEHLELSIPTKGQTYRGKIAWCDGREMGVALETDAGFGNSGDDELSCRVARLEAEIIALKQMIKRLQRNAADNTEAA